MIHWNAVVINGNFVAIMAFRFATLALLIWLVKQGRSQRLRGLLELDARVTVLEKLTETLSQALLEKNG